MQGSNNIIIKGVRDGLLFILDDDAPFSEILTELSERIGAQPDFFKGANVTLNTGRRIVDRPEFDVIYKMLTRHEMQVSGFVSLSAQSRMVAEAHGVASRPPAFAAGSAGDSLGLKSRGAQDAEANASVFLKRNIETGQSVRCGGDVCVLGDVEAGAEIISDGNIVVWGALLGTAHAGANGDLTAVVCALLMSPTQLNIAGYMSRFPVGEVHYSEAQLPEIAHVEMGRIVVEAWRILQNPT